MGGSESPEGTTRGDDGLSSTWTGARRDPDQIWEGDREGGEKQRVISPAKPNGLIHRHEGGRKGEKRWAEPGQRQSEAKRMGWGAALCPCPASQCPGAPLTMHLSILGIPMSESKPS